MDVERIQKINNLALRLMEQGLASDRDEAITQAEKIFPAGDSDGYNNIREQMQEPEQSQVEAKPLGQDEIKDILQKNTQFIVKSFKELNTRIELLEQQISDVKNMRVAPKIPTVGELLSSSQKEKGAPQEAQQEKMSGELPPHNPEEAKNHPRSGNYNVDDVSIEKFFYMGSK